MKTFIFIDFIIDSRKTKIPSINESIDINISDFLLEPKKEIPSDEEDCELFGGH